MALVHRLGEGKRSTECSLVCIVDWHKREVGFIVFAVQKFNDLPAQVDDDNYKNDQYQQQQHASHNDSNKRSCSKHILCIRLK